MLIVRERVTRVEEGESVVLDVLLHTALALPCLYYSGEEIIVEKVL
jgi:hypothetical protein